MDPLLVKIRDFAALCGKDRSWAYRMVKERRIAIVRLDGSVRVSRADIDAFLAAHRIEAVGRSVPTPPWQVSCGAQLLWGTLIGAFGDPENGVPGRIHISPELEEGPALFAELESLRTVALPGGRERFEAGSGVSDDSELRNHGDRAAALALAVIRGDRGQMRRPFEVSDIPVVRW